MFGIFTFQPEHFLRAQNVKQFDKFESNHLTDILNIMFVPEKHKLKKTFE